MLTREEIVTYALALPADRELVAVACGTVWNPTASQGK